MTSLILPPAASEEKPESSAVRVRDLYDKGSRAIRPQQLQYKLNASYLAAEQWVFKHSTRQEILRLPHDPRRVRVTIPRIGPESRRIMAKLLKRPLMYEVTPSAPDEATIRAAKISEGVITSVSDSHNWNQTREELAWACWKGGTAALCLDWDTSAGTTLSYDPITQRPVGTGDIKETVVTISEMVTEPGTRDIERATWWIKAQALPAAEVKRLYKLPQLPAADADPQVLPTARQQNGDNGVKSMTLVLTYYERPNPDEKKGKVLTVVGQKVVDGPHPWPFPFTDRLNIALARETLVEGQWTGTTIVSDAVPIQTALNASWTNILEHLKSAGNARIQASETSRDLTEGWTDEAAEFIYWRDQPHAWLAPPQMPAWWAELPARLSEAMDDTLGVHDISRGQAPSNIQSGLGLSILSENDDTPSGKFSQTLADAFSAFGTMVMQTYQVMVEPPEQRKSQVVSKGGPAAENISWSGQDLMDQTTVKVPYDAVAPLNEAARYARLQFFVQAGMITSPRAASAYLDVPGMAGDFIEGIDPQVAKARRENYEIMQGEVCIPRDFDDHAVHIEEHNSERLSARYERATPEYQEVMDMHVQAHSTMAAEEAGEQALKAQYAPALAAAAQGNQPPGSTTPLPSTSPQANLGASMGGDPNGPPGGDPGVLPAPEIPSGDSLSPPGQLPPLGISPLGAP